MLISKKIYILERYLKMMRDSYLDISKLTTSSDVMRLFKVVADHGGVLRFVGGAVRDALKGLSASGLNLATDLSPEELVEACIEEGITTVPLGIKQKAVGVVIGSTKIEVSSLYKYVPQKDGTLQVEFTDNWEEDASRRDLTINAVYADEKGNVFDYYNGIEDLEKGFVRFIGSAPQKLKEDYSRILRYFRFYSLFGLEEPNKKAIEACRENAAGLKKVPMEGVRDELFKIIQTPNAPRTFRLMQENGVLSYIMPDAAYIDDLEFFNTIAANREVDDIALIKMFVLYRPDKALAENLAVRLKFSRREKQLFTMLAAQQIDLPSFLNRQSLIKAVYLFGADFVKAKFLTLVTAQRNVPDNLWEIYQGIDALPELVFPLKGKDLLDNGLDGQHQIGHVLKELEQLWVDSEFTLSKEQLLNQMDNVKEVV